LARRFSDATHATSADRLEEGGVATPAGRGLVWTDRVHRARDAGDPAEHLGWSVIVTGRATIVRDRDEVTRYERLLRPWVDGIVSDFIRIEPALVTGYELAE